MTTPERFLRTLYGDRSGFFCIAVAVGGDDTAWSERFFRYPDQLEGALQYVKDHRENSDVYFTPHLLTEPRRMLSRAKGITSAVETVSAIWADFDAGLPDNLQPEPSGLIQTSPGRYQAYWLFKEPVGRWDAEQLCRRVAHHYNADSKWYLTVLLRFPGTLNVKRDRDEVKLLQWAVLGQFESRDFDHCTLGDEPQVQGLSLAGLPPVEKWDWKKVADPRTKGRLRGILGKPSGADRSGQVFELASAALEMGIPAGAIRSLVWELPAAVDKFGDLLEEDLWRILLKELPRHEGHAGTFKWCEDAWCPATPEWQDQTRARPMARPDQPVETAELLDEVVQVLKRFVYLQREQEYYTIAVWIAHTWLTEAIDSTGYLWVSAPQIECGKTRLLEVIRELGFRPSLTADRSASALFRSLERAEGKMTLLLDELHHAFGTGNEDGNTLGRLLDAGYKRGATIERNVKVGQDWQPKDFPTFCPKALAGIGDFLPESIQSRSIPIRMHRKPKDVEVERFHYQKVRKDQSLAEMRGKLEAWSTSPTVLSFIQSHEPEYPESLSDRQVECWWSLFAVADQAGGDWPKRIRRAATSLHEKDPDEEDLDIRLLRDLRDAFDKLADTSPKAKVSVQQIFESLTAHEDEFNPWVRMWGTWNSYAGDLSRNDGALKGIGRQIAMRLKQYGIKPKDLWIQGRTQRGYERGQLEETWKRYL